MRKVIVTGANGFIGSALIKRLIRERISILAIDISFQNTRLPENDYITRLEIGAETPETVGEKIPFGEYDAFYHFAWRGVNGPDKANPVVQLQNAQLALSWAMLAQRLGCKKYLCAGTIAEQSVNSLPHLGKTSGGMMYGTAKHCTHLMLETYCKSVGLDFVWMQFSNIYGPENKTGNLISYTLGELAAGREATFGPAMQPYDFIYIHDLIEAIYRIGVSKTTQNFYFIGSGQPRVLRDYLLETGEACGRTDLIKIGARPDDGVVYQFDMFDTAALVKDIGPYVSMNFSEGIRHTIENY